MAKNPLSQITLQDGTVKDFKDNTLVAGDSIDIMTNSDGERVVGLKKLSGTIYLWTLTSGIYLVEPSSLSLYYRNNYMLGFPSNNVGPYILHVVSGTGSTSNRVTWQLMCSQDTSEYFSIICNGWSSANGTTGGVKYVNLNDIAATYKYAIPITASINSGIANLANGRLLCMFTLKDMPSISGDSTNRLHFYLDTSGTYDHHGEETYNGPYLEIRKGRYNSSRTSQALIAKIYDVKLVATYSFETKDTDEDIGDYWYGFSVTCPVTVFGRYYDESMTSYYGWIAKWDGSWTSGSPSWAYVKFNNVSETNGSSLSGNAIGKQALHWYSTGSVTYTGLKNN